MITADLPPNFVAHVFEVGSELLQEVALDLVGNAEGERAAQGVAGLGF